MENVISLSDELSKSLHSIPDNEKLSEIMNNFQRVPLFKYTKIITRIIKI